MAFTLHFLERAERDQPPYEEVEAHYRELIHKAKERSEDEEFRPAELESALFAVCAWIDEALLMSQWKEKEQWRASPMQVTYFDTWNGGEEFFSRLAALDEREDQAREVYYYCLAMGFKGSLFRQDDQEILERIKAEQRAGIATRYRAQQGLGPLFPLSYGKAHVGRKRRSFPLTPFVVGLGFGSALLLLMVLLLLYRHILDSTVAAYTH
jgi:type VI secretion system protein ImpK